MLAIEQLSKHFGARSILDAVSFRFPEGEKIALVGPNGAGKTTLLNILTGLEIQDGGQIVKSQGLVLGYLPQEPESNPESTVLAECLKGHQEIYSLKCKMDEALEKLKTSNDESSIHLFESVESRFRQADGYSLEAKASGILSGLGFANSVISQNPLSLSGGWRMRLELAKVFLKDPDFLILDEPTNHLDLPSLVWVEKYLKNFRGTLLFVSHDRALLNRLATQTLLLTPGQLRPYKGNFDKMLEQRQLEEEQNEARRQNLERQREQLEDFVDRFGAKASKARQAQSKAKQIEKLKDLEADIEDPLRQDVMAFKLPEAPPSGRIVFDIKDLAIGYSGPLAKGINLSMERGLRIAIIGSNGIGKSTFLKTLAGRIASLEGDIKLGHQVKLGYCAQNHEDILSYERTVLDNILSSRADIGEKEARQILGSFLFSGDNVFKPVKVLSGGEKARVALCSTIVQPSNCLLLDEPTNHLDMVSVDILIEGLRSYSGSLIFVSHDRNFIESLATHIFVMLPDGRSALFHGNLDDYQRLAASQGFPNVLNPDQELAAKKSPQGSSDNDKVDSQVNSEELVKSLKRERSRIQKLLERLEVDQQKNQATIAKLEQELASIEPNNYVLAQKINQELVKSNQNLQELEESWLQLAGDLEAAEEKLASLGRLVKY